MVKTKRNSIISLCMILVLMLSAVVGIFAPQKSVEAYQTSGTGAAVAGTNYDKITLFQGETLKSGGLNALYKRLLKSSTDKTLDDVKSALQNDADHALNASDFRVNNVKGVVIQMGTGLDGQPLLWQVVYLSKSTNGDIIATLYVIDCLKNSSGSEYVSQQFHSSSNIYSTSDIRSYLVDTTTGKPNSTNFASLATIDTNYDCFESPQNMAWQLAENQCLNDNMSGTTGDKVWLPSLVELQSELWSLNADELIFAEGPGTCTCWLRSGDYEDCACIFGSGSDFDSDCVDAGYKVRPALHINLSVLSGDTETGAEIVILPLVIMILSGFGIAFVNLKGNKKRAKKII